MATITLGSTTTTALTALAWQPGGLATADIATIQLAILSDGNVTVGSGQWSQSDYPLGYIYPGALDNNRGILTIPNRGQLKLLPGDVIAVDRSGWPILIGSYALANGNWTHS